MRNRRRYEFEIGQTVLSIAIVVLTVILFFRSAELTVLYPVVFGLSALLSVIYALEGILYNRNRVTKKTRLIVFGAVAAVLLLLTVVSAIIIAN